MNLATKLYQFIYSYIHLKYFIHLLLYINIYLILFQTFVNKNGFKSINYLINNSNHAQIFNHLSISKFYIPLFLIIYLNSSKYIVPFG